MEARDAAAVTARAALTLARAIKNAKDPKSRVPLADGLSALAARMGAKEGAATLAQAIEGAEDPNALEVLARGLSALAARMEARDAAAVTARAALTLARAIEDGKEPDALPPLARGLSALAAHIEPGDAAAVTGRAATTLTRAIKDAKDVGTSLSLAKGLSALAARMAPKDAAAVPFQVAVLLMEKPSQRRAFSALLSAGFPATDFARPATAASALAVSAGQPLTALAPLLYSSEPPPGHLSPQQIVDLLKMPTCVGYARRVVLDHLGKRYHHTFADPWELVRFAEEQKLGLDFNRPPPFPEPAAPAPAKP
jgi:hypothetical protein